MQDPDENGECGDGDDRTEGDVAKEQDEDNKDRRGDQYGLGGNHNEGAESGSDALPSAKFQPDGEEMPGDGAEGGEGHHRVKISVAGVLAREGCGNKNGGGTFQGIEYERQYAERGGFAGDIGGADVAAAGAADVFPAKDADENIAEWDRAQEIADGGDEEDDVHLLVDGGTGKLPLRFCSRQARATAGETPVATLKARYFNGNLSSLVYLDPFGESWL